MRNLFFRIGWLEFEILQRWALGDAEAIAQAIANDTTLEPEAGDIREFVLFLQHHHLLQEARPRSEVSPWQWLLHNYLSIRIPLVRPTETLRYLLPYVRWIYTPWFAGLTLLAAITGLLLAAQQWDAVKANLQGALSWDGIAAFAIALVFSKIWHELGHAFTATRLGVRVGHMGIAFVVLWPMAYTDTGESWKLKDPRKRLAIASAGILAELLLAAWSTLLWAFAPEGNIKNALFFLATTAWVLTLLLNASPFMRFDGYFILSDAIDYPGLHERAAKWAKRWLRRHLLGMEDPMPEVLEPRFQRFLTAFAVTTWIYRFLLFVGIAVVVYHAVFKPLGILLFCVEMSVFVIRPIWMEMRVWHARRSEIRRTITRQWLAALLIVLFIVLVPWSSRVSAPGVLTAGSEQPVYTPFAARLERIDVTEGTLTRPGSELMLLSAPLQDALAQKAQAMQAAYEQTAQGALALTDNGAAKQVVADQLAQRYDTEKLASDAESRRLQLVTREGGTIRDLDETLMPGSWVSANTHIAVIVGGGTRWRVAALVSETDRQRLTVGASASVYVNGTFDKLSGKIVAIDNNAVVHLPNLLLAKDHGGPIALNPTKPRDALVPADVWYRVLVEGSADHPVVATREVTVHLDGERQSLAQRWINSTLLMFVQQSDLNH